MDVHSHVGIILSKYLILTLQLSVLSGVTMDGAVHRGSAGVCLSV